jgi:hypothetical protein
VEILNNFIELPQVIDSKYQETIYNTLTDIKFPWYYMPDTTYEVKQPQWSNSPAFGHLLYSQNTKSEYLDLFTPLMQTAIDQAGLKLISPLRLRLGFLLNTIYPLPSIGYRHNTPHVDFETDHYTICYYVNSSDGPTIVFNEKEKSEKYTKMKSIEPRQGTAICFDGKYYHASTCPKMNMSRIVLTINFTAEPK